MALDVTVDVAHEEGSGREEAMEEKEAQDEGRESTPAGPSETWPGEADVEVDQEDSDDVAKSGLASTEVGGEVVDVDVALIVTGVSGVRAAADCGRSVAWRTKGLA